jgi:hypothetical protein
MSISLKRLLEAESVPAPRSPATKDPKASTPTAPSAPTVPPAEPVSKPQQSDTSSDTYNLKFDIDDFENKISQSSEKLKNDFKDKILSKIGNKKIQIRASKGYGQPEKDFIVNVDTVSIDFYYEKYVVVIKGREPNKQKEGEYFIKPPYVIKLLGAASAQKSKTPSPKPSPVVPDVTQNVATKGI